MLTTGLFLSAILGAQSPVLQFARTLPGTPWTQHSVQGPTRPITIFIHRDEQPKPVVLLLQGSGCTPLFTVDGDGTFHGTTIFDDLIEGRASRFHFVLVEKPGVEPLRFAPEMTREDKMRLFEKTVSECSETFLKNETKDVRVADAEAVIAAVAGQKWARQILIAGHSEGTQVATGLLKRDAPRRISAAALLSSDLFVLEALRQQPSRPLRYVVVSGGDHGFATPDGRPHLGQVIDDHLAWALDPARRTAVDVLK